jgi:hypothetical protein
LSDLWSKPSTTSDVLSSRGRIWTCLTLAFTQLKLCERTWEMVIITHLIRRLVRVLEIVVAQLSSWEGIIASNHLGPMIKTPRKYHNWQKWR